jgi:ABC-type phosphate/phosphonate transport system substrate-binding protein
MNLPQFKTTRIEMTYRGFILSILISLRLFASAHDVNTSCFPIIAFNPEKHKTVYRLGVLANRGVEAAYKSYNSTFSDYLTATAGKRFDPPITFEMQDVSFQTMYDLTASNEIDFLFVNSAAAECISAQYSTQSLATIVGSRKKDGQRYNTSTFGGLVISRADKDDINRIEDLKDKVIAAISISGFGAGLMQFYEMEKRGLSYINDPAQMIFTGNQNLIVRGVLDGSFDVGFVRTGQIEKSKDPDGNKIDPSLLKIIESRTDEEDGAPFPYEHTTALYPEWNIASTKDTPEDVSREVQVALLALAEHARTGHAIEACQLSNTTEQCTDIHGLDPSARCDASMDAAIAASQALADGKYSRWRIALSMNKVRNVLQETNFIQNDPELNMWRCNPPSNLYNQISCPEGTNKVSELEFDQTCAKAGLECPDDFQCFCRPCIALTACDRAAYSIGGRCVSIWILMTGKFTKEQLLFNLFPIANCAIACRNTHPPISCRVNCRAMVPEKKRKRGESSVAHGIR